MRRTLVPHSCLLLSPALAAGLLACASGCEVVNPILIALDNNRPDDQCLDEWSIPHFASGYTLGAILGGGSAAPTTGLLTGWEIVEPQLWPGFDENELNQQCDLAVGMLGWFVQTGDD